MVESLETHLSLGTSLENALNQVVVINEQGKYVEGFNGTWLKSLQFLDRVNLTNIGVIGNAFESWDIAGKCFHPSICHNCRVKIRLRRGKYMGLG